MSKFKPGDMVQVWDWQSSQPVAERLSLHRKLGYLVKLQHACPKSKIWEVIFFYGSEPERHVVNEQWLRKINDASDIKKKA